MTDLSRLDRWLMVGLLLLAPLRTMAAESPAPDTPPTTATADPAPPATADPAPPATADPAPPAAVEPTPIEASLNLNRETHPIHPFIYGQFIEHLGRCIYGGIWAELLEDRKFFHPPGSPDSPWRKFGTEIGWSLLHDPERFYTGNASVKISMTTRAPDELQGIQQAALGLWADRDYRGHVILAGRGTVKVRLQWGSRPSQSDTATFRLNQQNFGRYPFHFRPGTTTTNGILTLGLESSGAVWIGAASLMPVDHVDGLRPDTLKLLRELDSPIYRWPGGNFVSGYDWRDGIGPKDRRPPRKNPAWQGTEPNDFGIDEFIALCRRLGTEPLVVVNTGLGSPELAAALVQYCNGGPQTIWGRRRAAHGQPQPYGVKWWGVGNEMYGDWQLGHVDLGRYQVRHREFVRAMRAVDPDIRIIAVGATGPWSEGMLTHCAQEMDLLSEHFYCGEQADLEAHVAAIPNAIRDKASAHRRYLSTLPSLKDRFIPIALDEWNYWYGPHLYGELGVRYTLRDALGIARGIHEMVRQSDVIQMANYAQTVNVIGAIKTTDHAAAFDATGLPLKLYRRHFGTQGLELDGDTAPLDVAAALTADRRQLTLAIVNPTPRSFTLKLNLANGRTAPQATHHLITGPDPLAFNAPGLDPVIQIHETVLPDFNPAAIAVAPLSVNLYVVPFER
jgi:alpha-L-arabinofuranosidase